MQPCKLAHAFLLSLSLLSAQALAAVPTIGDMAPDEFGRTITGDIPKLADFQGKVVVITFWATWCGYCMKELPVLEGLQRAGKNNVQVVAINTEERDVFRQAERALRSSVTMKLTYDAGGKGAKLYDVKSYPYLVIIGRDGKIIDVHHGYAESMLPKILDAVNLAIATPAPAAAAK